MKQITALSGLTVSLLTLSTHQALASVSTDTLVVTATRTTQTIDDVNAAVQVIDRKQLDSFSGRNLSDALQYATGLFVRDSGSSSSVSFRGFDRDHTLILVDGLRRTEKYAGSNLNNLSLQNVERIEIVRGPMSALYGSDALGGVINIITRKADQNNTRLRLTAGGSADNGGRESLLVQLGQDWVSEHTSHSLGIEHRARNPYNKSGQTLNEEQRSFLNYQGRFDLADNRQLKLAAEYLDQNDKNADRSTGRFEKEQRYQISGSYQQQSEIGQLVAELGYGNSDATVNRSGGDETTDFDQLQSELRYSGEYQDHLFALGVGYHNDDADISINTQSANRDIYHLFVQDQWQLNDHLDLTLGLRHDDYSDFGSTTNPRIALAWQQGPWKLRAGYGSAFNAPSLIQMYSTFSRRTSVINGNPNLKPEESRTAELAARYQFSQGYLELTLHHSSVDQLIASEIVSTSGTCPGRGCNYNYLYQNINKATLQGAELTLNLALAENHQMRSSAEYLDARDDKENTRLTDRARWQSYISLNSTLSDQWSSTVRWRYTGDYYATQSRTAPAHNSHFSSVDLNLQYTLNQNTRLFAGVDNLTDRSLPDNMSRYGSALDPVGRYYYAGAALNF